MMRGQVGPRTALKWRIRGMMLPERRVSIMTATLLLVVIFAIGGWGFAPRSSDEDEDEDETSLWAA